MFFPMLISLGSEDIIIKRKKHGTPSDTAKMAGLKHHIIPVRFCKEPNVQEAGNQKNKLNFFA